MNKCYLGIDIGSISTKGVILDLDYNILSSNYIWTNGNPIEAVKSLIKSLKIPDGYVLRGIGTTGSARKLIGLMLGANVVKNEIISHAIGTLNYYPNCRTILEIGGQDSKIIMLNNGVVTDYRMNTLCAAGTGAFLSSQAKRLNLDISEFEDMALSSKNPVKIAARCTVFAESDLVHKAQLGYSKEDIVAGLCKSIVLNYLNNLCKGKNLLEPIVFQGGVSKNKGVEKYFNETLNTKVIVDKNSHLMGAIGVAILSSKDNSLEKFDLNISDMVFETKGTECMRCANNCEIIKIFKNGNLIDTYGNRCENGIKN